MVEGKDSHCGTVLQQSPDVASDFANDDAPYPMEPQRGKLLLHLQVDILKA
jgi:hypothetical protein